MANRTVSVNLTEEELEELLDSLAPKMCSGGCLYLNLGSGIRPIDLFTTLHNARAEVRRKRFAND